ncbi:MAG: hypothetical protein AAGK14_03835 [Verrucomicrobiota bacterium]
MSGPKCVGLSATERELLRQDNAFKCDQRLARYRRRWHELATLNRERENLGATPVGFDGPSPDELRKTVDEAVAAWLDCDALSVLEHQIEKIEAAIEQASTDLTASAETHAEDSQESAGTVRSEPAFAPIQAGTNPSLRQFLTTWQRSRSTDGEADAAWRQKLQKVFDQLAASDSSRDWSPWQRRLEGVIAQTDPGLRRSQYEGLVLEASAQVRQAERRRDWRVRLDSMLDELAPCRSETAGALRRELEQMTTSGPVPTSPRQANLRSRFQACLQEEREYRQRESRRRAIVESLRDIGYEPAAALETAWVEDGKLVVQKPAESEYAVEIKTDGDAQLLQTALVRWGGEGEPGQQQRMRDQEQEEAWCREHAELLAKLEARGYANAFQFKLSPGEQAVRVLPRGESPRRERSSGQLREKARGDS